MINEQILRNMMNDVIKDCNIDSDPKNANADSARKMLYLHALFTGSLGAMDIGLSVYDVAKILASFAKFFNRMVEEGHIVAETNRKAQLN